MLFYLYLKKQDVYFTLTRITYDSELAVGMTITFEDHELATFAWEYPELRGMSSTCSVTGVYGCDGMGGITLIEVAPAVEYNRKHIKTGRNIHLVK